MDTQIRHRAIYCSWHEYHHSATVIDPDMATAILVMPLRYRFDGYFASNAN